jgi:hypothetical protein
MNGKQDTQFHRVQFLVHRSVFLVHPSSLILHPSSLIPQFIILPPSTGNIAPVM